LFFWLWPAALLLATVAIGFLSREKFVKLSWENSTISAGRSMRMDQFPHPCPSWKIKSEPVEVPGVVIGDDPDYPTFSVMNDYMGLSEMRIRTTFTCASNPWNHFLLNDVIIPSTQDKSSFVILEISGPECSEYSKSTCFGDCLWCESGEYCGEAGPNFDSVCSFGESNNTPLILFAVILLVNAIFAVKSLNRRKPANSIYVKTSSSDTLHLNSVELA